MKASGNLFGQAIPSKSAISMAPQLTSEEFKGETLGKSRIEPYCCFAIVSPTHGIRDFAVTNLSRPACLLPLTLSWPEKLQMILCCHVVFMALSALQDCVESFWHQTRCSPFLEYLACSTAVNQKGSRHSHQDHILCFHQLNF